MEIMKPDEFDLDEIVILGLEPRTWYDFVLLEINLLHKYVEGLEAQIEESIKDYESGKVATDVEHYDEDNHVVILAEHRGLEFPPDYLEEIFKYYFPNLQRRSTLIALYSFFENQLDKLCKLFATTQQLSHIYAGSRDKGIDRARGFLVKEMGLPLNDNSTAWEKIKRIQKIRNLIVHDDAKLRNDDIKIYVDKSKYLSRANESLNIPLDEDEVNLSKDYLTYVLVTFDSYCSEVNKAIETLQP
jgi:hypothetical protein